ncbi:MULTISPECIES: phospholipase D family nuclease [Acutalibacteraceae]|uniref:phospholipase D family nuclease n=1 Tax=Acutalibacteraceae TaxID=3082771 RepID=UPI00196A4643|nr:MULTISPECIES: phospholipase D family protein [Acutalibacteraceae]
MKKRLFTLILTVTLALGISGCSAFHDTASQLFSQMENVPAAPVSAAVSGSSVSVYFPRAGQDAEGKLIEEIGSAEKRLDVAIYSFTDKKVADAIAGDKKRGVAVRLISDKECSGASSQKACLKIVKNAGIPVKVNSHSGIMHLKVSIIDDSSVTTGSYNYTASAQKKNDENLVVVANETIAGEYEKEFDRMWNDTKNYTFLS